MQFLSFLALEVFRLYKPSITSDIKVLPLRDGPGGCFLDLPAQRLDEDTYLQLASASSVSAATWTGRQPLTTIIQVFTRCFSLQ